MQAARDDDDDPQGPGQYHADLVRGTYDDPCETLACAQGLTGNREPEMAEVIAELQRLKEDYRELID